MRGGAVGVGRTAERRCFRTGISAPGAGLGRLRTRPDALRREGEAKTIPMILGATAVDMKLEVVVVPVSDVDKARDFYFYKALGWRLDADFAAGEEFRWCS